MGPVQAEPEVTSELHKYVPHTSMPSLLTKSSLFWSWGNLVQPADQGRKAWIGSEMGQLNMQIQVKKWAAIVISCSGVKLWGSAFGHLLSVKIQFKWDSPPMNRKYFTAQLNHML